MVGGRNGFGAKLANVFSKKFNVECVDSHRGKALSKTWKNNMKDHDVVRITGYNGKKDYTKITFWPDLAKFGMVDMEHDIFELMVKRTYDMCGIFGGKVKVFLNGERL